MAVSDYKVRSVSTIDSLSEYLENRSAETGDLQKKIVQGMDETDLRKGVGKLSSQMGAPLLFVRADTENPSNVPGNGTTGGNYRF